MSAPTHAAIDSIRAFWLGDSLAGPEAAIARGDWWYRGGAAVDEEIRARFGFVMQPALAGRLTGWAGRPAGDLALVLVLDQFTRNLFRATPRAYAGDAAAMQVLVSALSAGLDRKLHPVERIWLYHPCHHAEDLSQQDRGLALLRGLLKEAPADWKSYVERSIQGWTRHRDIVARFGRFPHRNRVLGRRGSAAEDRFLAEDGETYGQGEP